jgi:ketosteroid isomerase-like protein
MKFMAKPLVRFAAVAALAAALLVQGCSQISTPPIAQTSAPADNRAADEAAIRAQSEAWSAASQSKDLDKIVSFYAPDGVALPDGAPIEPDPASIRNGWKGLTDAKDVSLGWTTTKVEAAKSGDIAYEYGAYHLDITGKDGKVSTRTGKYVLAWKKQADGTWKVAVDTDNSDSQRQL